MTYTSKHWSVTEWDCYQRRENEYAHDDENGRLVTENEDTANLFRILDMLRDWNPHWVVNWTNAGYKSGYRTRKVNAEVGGVTNSNHLFGCAADIHESNTDASAEELAETIKAAARYNGLGNQIELGIYSGQGWCHIATPGYSNVYYG